MWGEDQDRAFCALKQALSSREVMAHPKIDEPYKLYTDASDYAIGAILVQEDEDGVEMPLQYLSKKLEGSQLNWATIEGGVCCSLRSHQAAALLVRGSVYHLYGPQAFEFAFPVGSEDH